MKSSGSHRSPAQTETLSPITLGTFAHSIIQKQFKKATRYKKQVLRDTDPEALHQMRVGYRRLQAAFTVFDSVVKLPEVVTESAIRHVIKRLGGVRDLDVLLAWLHTFQTSHELSADEIQTLDTVHQYLQKVRKRRFRQLRKLLKSDDYSALVDALNQWAEKPRYQATSLLPLPLVLPDLVLPPLSDLLQHPAWLVGTHRKTGLPKPLRRMSQARIDTCLAEQGAYLHDLRKQAKRLRYEFEFFTAADSELSPQIEQQANNLRQIQAVLGTLQDETIITGFLSKILGDEWATQLPTLTQHFSQERRKVWKDWQSWQTQYLDPKVRQQLRQQLTGPAQLSIASAI
ncbi:MAG: CHAD domain-containing protein [Cyanobacteria bacterium J06628_6]